MAIYKMPWELVTRRKDNKLPELFRGLPLKRQTRNRVECMQGLGGLKVLCRSIESWNS